MADIPGGPTTTPTLVGERKRDEPSTEQEFQLVLLNTDRAGSTFPLGDRTLVGKASNNDVVIEHPTVSRNHLALRREGFRFLVEDLVPGPVLPLIDEVLTALGVADLVDVTAAPATGALSIARRTCCLAFTLPQPKICTGCCIR